MAVQTLSILPIQTTDAQFRAWGLAVHNALVAVGLTNTADTGQINWATVLHPTVATTSMGYEIWQFTDSLQATAPVFVRLDYGSGGVAGNPQIGVTVGTATDGAGTITANVSFPNSLLTLSNGAITNATAWAVAAASNLYVDSDGGSSLMIAGWVNPAGSPNPASSGIFIVVERTRNWDGTPNGNGVIVMANPGNAASPRVSTGMVVIAQAATYTGHTTNFINFMATLVGTIALSATRSAAEGATTFVFPVFTGWTPHLNAPSKHVVAAYINDIAANTQFQILSYGVLHTFNAWGVNNVSTDPGATGSLQPCFRVA